MKPKYQYALVLIRAGWSLQDVQSWIEQWSVLTDLHRLQACFARLHFDSVTKGYNSLLDGWGRLWAMTNCVRRGIDTPTPTHRNGVSK